MNSSKTPPRCAVIGHPIDHSLSPQVHQAFARQVGLDLSYDRLSTRDDSAAAFTSVARAFFNDGGLGLNVTLPFKEAALALADDASERAQEAGAANTLWHSKGQLLADNTDGAGLAADLQRLGVEVGGAVVLVLGAGGAARGIVPALIRLQPQILVIANRTMERAQTLVERFGDLLPERLIATADPKLPVHRYDLAINATAPGAAGPDDSMPELLSDAVAASDFCYDLSYRAETSATAFTAAAAERGAPASDGLGMLVGQAAEAFELWHGHRPDVEPVIARLRQRK